MNHLYISSDKQFANMLSERCMLIAESVKSQEEMYEAISEFLTTSGVRNRGNEVCALHDCYIDGVNSNTTTKCKDFFSYISQ